MSRYTRVLFAVATILAVTTAPAFAAKPIYTAHLSGDQAVPSRETQATGQAMFRVSSDQTSVEFRITVSNILNVVAARMALAPAGQTGEEVAILFGPVSPNGGRTNGVLATGTLTAANLVGPLAGQSIADLISQIEAGQIYVNVVTDDGAAPLNTKPGDFSTGEIRGQLQ